MLIDFEDSIEKKKNCKLCRQSIEDVCRIASDNCPRLAGGDFERIVLILSRVVHLPRIQVIASRVVERRT